MNIRKLLSRIIRFNIQKKPYGKLLFTPRSSSPLAASVCCRCSPPALVRCPSPSALACRRRTPLVRRRRPPPSSAAAAIIVAPLRRLRRLSPPTPSILLVVFCLRQPSLQYLVRRRCRSFLSAADIVVISRPPSPHLLSPQPSLV
jgi:hypothetical protein